MLEQSYNLIVPTKVGNRRAPETPGGPLGTFDSRLQQHEFWSVLSLHRGVDQ